MSIIFNYFGMHFKTQLQYKISFLLTFITQLLSIFAEFFVIYSLFERFSLLEEYNVYQLLLTFGIVWFGMSFSETFGRGFDHFAKLIKNGNFDLLLIRPRSLFIQIIGSEIAYQKFARLLSSTGMVIFSVIKLRNNISLVDIFVLILCLFASATLFISIFIIGAAFCFVTVEGLEIINIFTDGTRQLGQYPMKIYKKIIFLAFSFIIPLTAINYYPIEYIFNDGPWFYALMPLVVIIFFIISALIFKIGLNHYKSTGS
jgi:ABC-type uncharacterized transport system, permease component